MGDVIQDVELHPGEEFPLTANYTDVLASGETVSSGAAAVYDSTGGAGPSGLLSGTIVVATPRLQQKIIVGTGVTIGTRYLVVLTATTSAGLDYAQRFRVIVRALTEVALTLSTHALTTVENVKTLLAGKDTLPTAEHDDLFRFLINALSDAVEQYCGGRHFEKATYTSERYSHPQGQYLALRQYPILTVTSVVIDTTTITAGTDDDDYSILAQEGQLFRADGWDPDVTPLTDDRDIVVSYTAGYVLPKDHVPTTNERTLPWDLEYAAAQLVVAAYKLRDKAGLGAESFEGLSMSFSYWPPHVRATLDRYRRPRL